MHELLLFGTLPAARHEHFSNVLAGVCAMPPRRVVERRALYKPSHIPTDTAGQRGGTQNLGKAGQQQANKNTNIDVFYMHLVREVDEDEFGKQQEEMEADGQVMGEKAWELSFKDTPQPGKRQALLRMTQTTKVQSGEPDMYMKRSGYTYLSESIVEGHRFIYNNIILHLHRELQWPAAHPTNNIHTPLPAYDSFTTYDKSGAYILEANIRISESTPSLIKMAEDELVQFKEMMKGVIEMVVPERLALDTRVMKTRPPIATRSIGPKG